MSSVHVQELARTILVRSVRKSTKLMHWIISLYNIKYYHNSWRKTETENANYFVPFSNTCFFFLLNYISKVSHSRKWSWHRQRRNGKNSSIQARLPHSTHNQANKITSLYKTWLCISWLHCCRGIRGSLPCLITYWWLKNCQTIF